jgi:uncharacterized protein YciI
VLLKSASVFCCAAWRNEHLDEQLEAMMYIADPRLVPHDIFCYTLHPTRLAMLTEGATPEERTLAGQHWAYSQDLLSRGLIIFAGRTVSPTADSFALVVIRAPSLEAARAIAADDPAVRGGVFRMAVYPYQPMLVGAWPPEAAVTAETR